MNSRNRLKAITCILILLPLLDAMPQSSAGRVMPGQLTSGQLQVSPHPAYRNTRVNQDENIYPKAVAGAAIDPTDGRNLVVLDNDNRLGETFVHDFYHTTRDDGIFWADGFGPLTNVVFSSYDSGSALSQTSKGVAFDNTGHTYTALSVLNALDYANETSVAVSVGVNHGAYSTGSTVLDTTVFGSGLGCGDACGETLSAQGVAVDTGAGATSGRVYVFYTVACSTYSTCEGTVAPGATVMKVATSPGFGESFGPPQIWSQPSNAGQAAYNSQVRAGSMVVDLQGHSYLFFSDISSLPKIHLWQSTDGTAKTAPLAEFVDAGLKNPKWKFTEDKVFQCAEHSGMGYCAFTATQVGTATAAATPSVFLAAIDLETGRASFSRVNNDLFTGGKDHFNPAVAVTPEGNIYVGWFDNRKDPASLKVDYFVGKSTDGGKTFPGQHAVNDVSFDPTIGGIGPSGALLATPRNAVKAFWTDTRDGATQQIWSEDVR